MCMKTNVSSDIIAQHVYIHHAIPFDWYVKVSCKLLSLYKSCCKLFLDCNLVVNKSKVLSGLRTVKTFSKQFDKSCFRKIIHLFFITTQITILRTSFVKSKEWLFILPTVDHFHWNNLNEQITRA